MQLRSSHELQWGYSAERVSCFC